MGGLVVKKSKFGKGVLANKDFVRGEHICFWRGRRMDFVSVAKTLKKRGRNPLIDPFQISKSTYIAITKPYIYFNHSCEPNAGLRRKNELFALKNIKKGEEIFYDYSTAMDEGVDCKCGSDSCRGKIGDFFTLPKKVQDKYIKQNAVPDFIKKKAIDWRLQKQTKPQQHQNPLPTKLS